MTAYCPYKVKALYNNRPIKLVLWHQTSPLCNIMQSCKKSLKIPKGQSESVYRRRTDNTMTKRKSTKKQKKTNNDLQNLHIKLKIK